MNKKAAGSNTASLEGSWTLNYISGPRIAFEGLYPRQKPSLVFTSSTTEVGGHTSCNPFSAPVKMEGNKISFSDGRSTMMACEGQGESVFLNTLKKINTYSITGDTLTLVMNDVAMMRFARSR